MIAIKKEGVILYHSLFIS